MSHRWIANIAAAALAIGATVTPVHGQGQPAPAGHSKQIPRTDWGAPNLGGVWTGTTITPLQRPKELAGKEFYTPEEAAAVERKAATDRPDRWEYNDVWFDPGSRTVPSRRTSLVIDPRDGRIPFTAAGEKRNTESAARYGAGPRDSYADLDTGERCLTDGLPIPYYSGYNNNVHIFQTPKNVVIVGEMYGNRRVIPVDDSPKANVPQWLGQSRGRWEGDTLVVDTSNFADKAGYWWASAWRAARPTLRLTERFTRVDAETINYQFTMEDPEMFTRPWTMEFPLTNNQAAAGVTVGGLYEYACHEGNYGLVNTLRAARFEEANAGRGEGGVK